MAYKVTLGTHVFAAGQKLDLTADADNIALAADAVDDVSELDIGTKSKLEINITDNDAASDGDNDGDLIFKNSNIFYYVIGFFSTGRIRKFYQ